MKGILFKEEMYKVILAGKKSQTRRTVKQPKNSYGIQVSKNKDGLVTGVYAYDADESTIKPGTDDEWQILPRYKVGETLYLKEPYLDNQSDWGIPQPDGTYIKYKFDNFLPVKKWKNKLFMPERCARAFIKITDVTCERLSQISGEDCFKEGIQEYTKDSIIRLYKYGVEGSEWDDIPDRPVQAYQDLWNSINGPESWNQNPFVFVYTFEKI